MGRIAELLSFDLVNRDALRKALEASGLGKAEMERIAEILSSKLKLNKEDISARFKDENTEGNVKDN